MDISDLKTLLLVRNLGGFAAAARVLELNPASVSRKVAEVEAGLGIRVFQRSTRRFSVTEAGEAFLARLSPLLDEFDAALGSAEALSTAPTGTLRLTTSVSFGHEVLLPLLGAFHAAYPGVEVELILTDSNLDLVRERIDLALRLAPAPAGDLISTRILTARYRVVASPEYLGQFGHPQRPEEISGHSTLRFALPGYRDRWLFRDESGSVTEVPVHGWLVVSNALSLRRAALDGLGVTMLADWLVNQSIDDGALIDVFPDLDVTATGFEAGIWALYPSKAFLPQRVRLMIDFIRQAAAARHQSTRIVPET